MLAPWALKHKWLKKKIAWWLYQKRDLEGAVMFHVTAECEIKWLRDLDFKQPFVLAPLGADIPELSISKTRRPDMKTVLFVGRIYPVKGLINLVRAWAEVKEQLAVGGSSGQSEDGGQRSSPCPTNALMNSRTHELFRWQLVIAGPDQAGHKAEVVAEAKRLRLTCADVTTNALMHSRTNELPPDLVFTGPVYGADRDALHRMADLFVLPSFTENFGVVVTDALSYGIPVITTKGTPWQELLGSSASSVVHRCDSALVGDRKTGNLKLETRASESLTNELTRTGRAGWWIDIGVEPLVAALKEAISLTCEDRQTMGNSGRKLVVAKYTWEAMALEIANAYAGILGHSQKLSGTRDD